MYLILKSVIWLYDRGNYEALSIELNETNWNNLKNDDINIYAQNITDTIITAAKRHVPNKNIKVRQSDPPWLNNTIKKMIRKRKRLFNKFKSSRNDIDFQNYKRFRNKVTNAIRQSKKTILTDSLKISKIILRLLEIGGKL